MKNMEKLLSILGDQVDGLLLTSRYSRYYGAEFDIAEGVAVVSAKGCRYFTDSRYIESAQNGITGFQVIEMSRANPFAKLINEAIADFGITALGFEAAQELPLGAKDTLAPHGAYTYLTEHTSTAHNTVGWTAIIPE